MFVCLYLDYVHVYVYLKHVFRISNYNTVAYGESGLIGPFLKWHSIIF